MPRRSELDIQLGGMGLRLKYEAENLMELSRITGKDPVQFLDSLRGDNDDPIRQGLHASNLQHIVPLIMAGLAHHDEYAGLTDKVLRRRVCGLLDAQAELDESSVVIVAAKLVAVLVPTFSAYLTPPGLVVDVAKKADSAPEGTSGTTAGPLPEAEEAGSTGMT